MKKADKLSRRSFIKCTSGSLATLALSQAFTQRALAQTSNIKRVIFWYVPEGAAQQAFWPSVGPGPLDINMSARIDRKNVISRGEPFNRYARSHDNKDGNIGTYCLQPLKKHEADLTLVSGFENPGSSKHNIAVGNALTGGRRNEGSVDQHLGRFLKGNSAFHAIYSQVYGEHVSRGINGDYACPFRTLSGGQASPSWNPVTTYNQVFPNGVTGSVPGASPDHSLRSRLAVLDSISTQLQMVKCQGGLEAQHKMEKLLESFELIEKETQALVGAAPPPGSISVDVDVPKGWEKINRNNKYWHNPDNFGKMVKIQIDTTVAALALDRTRVSLMQFSASGFTKGISPDHYKRVVSGLEGRQTSDHSLGHKKDSVRRRDQARVFRWYYSQLAYLIDRLKSIPDGPGTLFDNTLIVCCSEYGMYDHRKNDIPLILAGNPGGKFRKGVYIDAYQGKHRPLGDFYLGICQAMGMNMNRFGNSNRAYKGFLI